ncbi:MAG: tetratricopeptide repeat protein [Bernardetiaceae bacterium]|jgi:tetratricopeptide (TPR) repeat protein|nr:tetratricopeptide repeat protein [Bernardetiaceae bacterium]
MRSFFLKALGALVLGMVTAGVSLAQTPDADGKAMDHFVRAESLRKSKRFIEAIAEYEKAISMDPNNFKYSFSRGVCYYMIKDADNAINSLQQSIGQKPDYVMSHALLAECYKAQKKYDEVVRSLDAAFKYDADTRKKLDYKRDIVKILVRNKEYARAKPHIMQAKAIAPSDPVILFMDGKVNNQLGDYKTARESLNRGITELASADPKEKAKYYYELGYAYYRLGQFENAWDTWKNANIPPFKNKIARYDPKVYLSNAICYYKVYDFAKARENAEIALKMQPNLSQAYMVMAEVDQKETKQEAAIANYNKALAVEADPARKAEIYKSMAYVLMQSGRFNDAVNASVNSLKNNPSDYNLHFLQAGAYFRMKNYAEAARVVEALLGNPALDNESKAQFNFALANVYRLGNQMDKAKAAYKRAEVGSFARTAQLELAALEGKDVNEETDEEPDGKKPVTLPTDMQAAVNGR